MKLVSRFIIVAIVTVAAIHTQLVASSNQKQTGSPNPTLMPVQRPDLSGGELDERAYQFYVNGVIHEQTGDFVGAAENYRRALKFEPDSYEIRLSFAQMLFKLQRFEETLGALDPIKPVDADVYRLKAACYRAMGDDDKAHQAYLDVVADDPDDINAFGYLASLYRQKGDVDSTIWAFENIVRIRPDNYQLWQDLAKHQIQLNHMDSAKVLFLNSIANSPTAENALSYVGLGEIYQTEEKNDSATLIFREGIAVDPNNTLLNRVLTSHYVAVDSLGQALVYARRLSENSPLDRAAARRLGAIYYELDSLDRARVIFESMAGSGDHNWIDHYYLGRIDVADSNLVRARDEFETVTQMADTLAGSWLDLAMIYRRMEKPDDEIKAYKDGLSKIKDDEGTARLLFALGAAYERENKIDEAISTFQSLIEKYPDNHQALNYLGYTLADRNMQLDYAQDLIDRAMKLEPDNAAYIDSYGWVLYRQGKYSEAVVQLTRAASLQKDPVIFEHLGDALDRVGDDKAAKEWWQKALRLDPDNKKIKEKLTP